MKFSKPFQCGVAVLCLGIVTIVPLWARTRKGDRFFKLGQAAEGQKKYEEAIKDYDQALATDPQDAGYVLASQRAHSAGSLYHIEQGRKLQQGQMLDQAMAEFQRAFLDDPGSQVAVQLVRETTEMIAQRAKSAPGARILTPAERAREEMEKRINSLQGPPQLKPIEDEIRSLKMNNQPVRVLYESVGKLAGINVVMDPQGIETIGGKTYNLDLNNVTLEEALDYIALETHTFWKPISHNAIFVTQESEPKRAEYQDEVVRVFYVQNSSSQAEFTEIFNAVRTGAHLNTGIFQVASQNAIIARGTVDAIALVEKLVHDLDRPKPEIMVDVLVLEVNKSKTLNLGANLLNAGAANLGTGLPISFTPRGGIQTPITSTTGSIGTTGSTGTSGGTGTGTTGTATTGTTGTSTGTTDTTGTTGTTGTSTTTSSTGSTLPISNLGRISSADFSTTLPGALLTALLSDSSAKVLQRPQIRATDGGKAQLKIGSKIPYASGSLNSAVATPGSIPYATTTFQQIDVGVVIDLQPHVNAPNDVSMHIKVELSNTTTPIDIGGISEPVIVQRVNEADIRMKEGEVSILGGLTDLESTLGVNGTPGLVNIPVLGYLFGQKNRTKIDDQVLIALIPHIVRSPDMSGMGDGGIYAGSERVVRVQRKRDGTASTVGMAPTDGTPGPPGYKPSANPTTQAPLPATPAAPSSAQGNNNEPGQVNPGAANPYQRQQPPYNYPPGYPRHGMQNGMPPQQEQQEPEPQPQPQEQ